MKEFIKIKYSNNNFIFDDEDNYEAKSRRMALRQKTKETYIQSIRPSDHVLASVAEFDLDEGNPDLSVPFPNGSLKAQLHIAAKNRRKLLEYQNGYEQRLMERWRAEQQETFEQLSALFPEDFDIDSGTLSLTQDTTGSHFVPLRFADFELNPDFPNLDN